MYFPIHQAQYEQKAMQLLEQNRQGHHLKKRNFKTSGKSC